MDLGIFDHLDRRDMPLADFYDLRLRLLEKYDAAGFYSYHLAEHHATPLGLAPVPGLFLAAATQRTRRIRLGPCVYCLPLYNPLRLIEEVCMLDQLSRGRFDFGVGRGIVPYEMAFFNLHHLETEDIYRETLEIVLQGLTRDVLDHRGPKYVYRKVPMILKPLQKPHPPLWVAASRRETTMVAARLGMGSLGFAFETPDEARERVAEYYQLVREECTPIGKAINPALAVLSSLMCCETDEEAIEKGVEGTQFFSYSLGYYYSPVTGFNHQPGKVNIYQRFKDTPEDQRMDMFGLRRRLGGFGGAGGGDPDVEPEDEVQRALWRAAKRGGCIGTPDFIRDTLRKYEAAHLDTMIFVAQSGARKHEDVMESIQRFGTQVLPEFKERHKEHQRWRDEQLAGVEYEINSSI
jgi:alkanesulfonate monooxygenase SsuD/methylene tetrahydromethanopterin reductase-like flavin-dependent oxidoreductase (luciferase family)